MGMIVTIGNEKGGTGKTTVALELALGAARMKDRETGRPLRVKMIDVDHQQSADLWVLHRAALNPEMPQIDCTPIVGRTVGHQIQKFAPDFDLIVVDVGGKDTAEFRSAALVSNLLIVPATPAVHDVWPLETVSRAVLELRIHNPALQCWLLPARIKPYLTKLEPGASLMAAAIRLDETIKASEEYAEAFDKVMTSYTSERAAYARAAELGLSVVELKGGHRDAQARWEIAALLKEIVPE